MSWLDDVWNWVSDTANSVGRGILDAFQSLGESIKNNILELPLWFNSVLGATGAVVGDVKYFRPSHSDPDVQALMSGSKWNGSVITYSLPDSRDDYSYLNPHASGFERLSAQSEQVVHEVMKAVDGYVNVGVAFTGRNDANIKVASFVPGSVVTSSTGYYPGMPAYGGETWIVGGSYTDVTKGSHRYALIMHELGHVLGLKHSHDAVHGLPKMSAAHDSTEYTVMSYHNEGHAPQSFMQYDIAALQAMYGADFTTNSSDTTYSWGEFSGVMSVNGIKQGSTTYSGKIFLTIWDGGGNDTYDMSNFRDDALIDLSPGGFSRFSNAQLAEKGSGGRVKGNVYNAFQYNGDARSLIENAIGGSGNDKIVGNQANNLLKGNAGNDELHGGAGHDTLVGGEGSDKFFGGLGSDRFDGGTGHDTVSYWTASGAVRVYLWGTGYNQGEAAGDSYVGVEVIDGSRFGDVLEGDARANIFWSDSGNDTLRGREGDDELAGASGDDLLYGDAGQDALAGGEGNDKLLGGAGADRLDGGVGRDTVSYWGAAAGVLVDLGDASRNQGEAAGDVYVSIEVVDGSTHADTIEGTDAADTFWGDAGNDVLRGRGNTDVLKGAAGDDWLAGGAGGDLLDGGDGYDTADYSGAASRVVVDRVNMGRNQGEAAGDAFESVEGVVGSAHNDEFYGGGGWDGFWAGAGDDVLEGRAGGDHLDGGAGFDFAVYWSATSGVVASLGNPMVNWGDAYGDTFESIEGLQGSNHSDSLYGFWSSNTLYGWGGNDLLAGDGGNDYLHGGDGADTISGGDGLDWLIGGMGRDYFRFEGPAHAANADTIEDFSAAEDLIQLSRSWFKVPGASNLDSAAFTIGSAATTAAHRIIYNKSSGELFYDADGSGMAAGQVKFASVGAGLSLTHMHFLIV